MLTEDFNYTIDIWIKELEHYDFNQLCAKPSSKSWSLGQVYMHLISDTNYYIEQIRICLSTNDNSLEEASQDAKVMFHNNDFPNEVIEGSPENSSMLQPANKQQLFDCLFKIKEEINELAPLISQTHYKGKTKHPGLNYFIANEWLQFAEMHFRHHLRQKQRIDNFLKIK